MPTSNLDPPTLSEVIRRLDDLRVDVRDVGTRFVSSDIYAVDKQVHDRETKELRERVAKVEAEADEREQRSQDQAAKNRQFLVGIVASPFVAAAVSWVISGGIKP